MPGLSQLIQFNKDILSLGDEIQLRAQRGEKPVRVPVPKVPDTDDSDEFVMGMPENEAIVQDTSVDDDLSDLQAITGMGQPASEESKKRKIEEPASGFETPDMSSLLSPLTASDEFGEEALMPDLSMFEEQPEEEVVEEEPEEPSIADLSLEDLLGGAGFDGTTTPEFDTQNQTPEIDADEAEFYSGGFGDENYVPKNKTEKTSVQADDELNDFNFYDETSSNENATSGEALSLAELGLGNLENEDETPADVAPVEDFDIAELSDIDPLEEEALETSDSLENLGLDDIDFSEEVSEPDSITESSDLSEPFNIDTDFDVSEIDEPDELTDTSAEESLLSGSDALFDMPEADEALSLESEENNPELTEGFGSDFEATDGLDSMPDFSLDDMDIDTSMPDIDSSSMDAMDLDLDSQAQDMNSSIEEDVAPDTVTYLDDSPVEDMTALGDMDIPEDFSADFGESDSLPEETPEEDISIETFDTSEIDGLDFSIPETDAKLGGADSGFELGNDDEFSIEGQDFTIPGFSDVETAKVEKSGPILASKTGKTKVEEDLPPNTLSDAQYKVFLKNLNEYPLNVRLAFEDLIVKNEFTDEAEFEIVEKILNKAPARQVASMLEKMLDISLPVPRDFERRTAEEYEAYKKSLQYQLKNRIIPAVIIGVFVFMVGFCSVYLGIEFIYKPIKAENYYKQGYALIENNEYPQSEVMFEKAVDLKVKKKWFFRYANGYREHNQYDRAEKMYKRILYVFDHDKKGGLEYVHMELDDLANYAKAEDILRREVLDYHINDADALLLLGDIFLEWGTEVDSSKFQDAYEQYTFLCQKYGAKDEYLARLMRYHVRTDSLKDVLSDKEYFYDDEDSLEAKDWTEMSGYLMDKLYGQLTPQEEYLRSSIEDVYSMLVRAIEKDPSDPISRYNMSRYYIESGDHLRAGDTLKKTIQLFDDARHLKARDTYKQLNTYRLLGEEYIYNRDYILASETLTQGIDLFEDKEAESGFDSDKNIGVMYSDMGDLEYFISGDLEAAKLYYEKSIRNKNDNSSVRYRVGYIDYQNKEYDEAFKNFIVASQDKVDDSNLLLALGNTLALRDDNYASAGYYDRLIGSLNLEIEKKDILMPQVNEEDTQIVDAYMKATNNLGVVQFRLARQTGDSSMNGKSIYNFQNSLRAWDSLTRNRTSLERLGGTNLAEQNIKYVTSPITSYEPAIYTDIPRILENEKPLE